MARKPIPTWSFAIVVVRLGRRILVVQERKHDETWYLPAGRVEAGETFAEAAHRETMEEAGLEIVLEGVLSVDYRPVGDGSVSRARVVYVARPKNDDEPRTEPNKDTLGAKWASIEELQELPLRSAEVIKLARYVNEGGVIYPLAVLGPRTAPAPSAPQ